MSEEDGLYISLSEKGYRLISSGSLFGPQQFTYSAYLFIDPESSPLLVGDTDLNEDTLEVAFYRWDGNKNVLLGIHHLPAYAKSYPAGALVVNWQQPSVEGMILDFAPHPDAFVAKLMNMVNYASDINQNGLPEFAFVVEYCPISCTHPNGGIQLFEVQSSSSIANITADLPGLTFFDIHSNDPLTFYVEDAIWYDFYLELITLWIYTWEGDKFVDVSIRYAEEYFTEAELIVHTLQVGYGKPFDQGGVKVELATLKILKLYEKGGQPDQGLQTFLDVTDPTHWPGTADGLLCWMQISRATAQEDRKHNRLFLLPPSSTWLEETQSLEQTLSPLRQAGYDVSACQTIHS